MILFFVCVSQTSFGYMKLKLILYIYKFALKLIWQFLTLDFISAQDAHHSGGISLYRTSFDKE